MLLRIEIKMLMLMLIMMWVVGKSVMVVKIMTSSMCTGVFVCAGGKPPRCTHCSAVLFLTDLLSVSLSFFVSCRSTWSQRGKCTWSSICPGPPLKVKPTTTTTAHSLTWKHTCIVPGSGIWWHKVQQRHYKDDGNESGKMELFKDNNLRRLSLYQHISCW